MNKNNGKVIYNNGDVAWWKNGKLHREDGPAVIRFDEYKSWWINGQFINCKSQEEFERLLKLKAFL